MVVIAFVSINIVLPKFCIMECLDNQATAMLTIVTMDDYSFTLCIEAEQNLYCFNYIIPADIINLFI